MTREEYLKQLKNNLSSLTVDEQNEAIQYYSDYFEEANDDEKIMAEFGTPEELAASIVEKMANGLSKINKENKEESEKTSSTDSGCNALFYSFDKNDVKSLSLIFSAAEVVVIPGECYAIETRGLEESCLNVSLSAEGLLKMSNNKRMNFNFWSHDRRDRIVPRILVTVPEKAELNRLKINLGAGNMETRNVDISFVEGSFEVEAGNLVLKEISGSRSKFRCGMGNLEIKGRLMGKIDVDCGMGAVKFDIQGDPEYYSYDAKVGLGDFRFNNEQKSMVGKYVQTEKKDNHISVNCGMGSVSVKVQK